MPAGEPQVVFDFPGKERRSFSRPREVLIATELSQVVPVLQAAEAAARAGNTAVGFVTYEAAPAFERVMQVARSGRLPLAWFAVFETASPVTPATNGASRPNFLLSSSTDWFAAVDRIRLEIARGRTYQVNLTTRFTAGFDGDALALYESLRHAQGSGYHAFLDTGDFQIVSVSPELFFERQGKRIRTRPMKGTRPRGRWSEEDDQLATQLAASEKDRAENLMIVDLLRNDVGRIAETGTVEVPSLFHVERYRTVHQMTSTIEADLRDGVGVADVFGALFPCGSVTGAPKISTMQVISELEHEPRGVYCGALGIIEPNGDATFNVPIRTLVIERETKRAVYGSGAGITYDSEAAAELAEVKAKAAVLAEEWPEFDLLETMRAEHGRVLRLERHLARLLASARYFDIPLQESSVRAVLAEIASSAVEPRRIRMLADRNGAVRTEEKPIEVVERPRVGLAKTGISSRDRFLFHKTTYRSIYDVRRAERPECWDVLLWNERGELTEFTRGNVVVELDRERLTPALSCGLLGGTFRAELLHAGVIHEAIVRVTDLPRVKRMWLINSVREWVDVGLED